MAENQSFYIFNEENNVFIFDSAPLIAGFDLNKLNAYCFTTSEILNEIKNKNAKEKADAAVEMGKLKIIGVPPEYIEKVKLNAKQSGDLKSLSLGDLSVLGLTLYLKDSHLNQFKSSDPETKVKLVTDDFSLQNVSKLLHLDIDSFKTQGIEKFIQWEIYCPLCFQIYPPKYLGKECSTCGGIIKRRPKKNTDQANQHRNK